MSGHDAALEACLRIGTPILLAGLGELILERAGVLNIGIEGVMLAGAFGGFVAAFYTGSPWAGALAGVLCGVLLMVLFAMMTLRVGADAIVTGMALNLLALGATGVADQALRDSMKGLSGPRMEQVAPTLATVPIAGPLLFAQTPLTWLALLMIPALWFYLQKTERGLELRAVGENPAAAEASGVSVLACRWKACLAAGAFCGLGGAFLSVSQTGSFTANGTAGRGFVALAAVMLGRHHPLGVAVACLFFGTAFYARDAVPSGVLSADLVETLPYVLTLAALCIRWRGSEAPAALGKPLGTTRGE